MRKHDLLMAMGLASLMAGPVPPMRKDEEKFMPDNDASAARYKRNLKDKGVRDFTIDGITVQARDEKNAIRKVNNIKRAKGLS